ncbi:MAG: adenylate/guanylate cyclase domain-containing protein [Hyphomicrobiaceae bacterium]
MAKAPEATAAPVRSQAELSGMSGWERSARLWSGLILFAFVLMHFLNHALGVFGVATLEYVQLWRVGIWRSTIGTVLLYGAAIVHVIFVLKRIIGRRTWRMPVREALQIALGLAIPFLLYEHTIGTRYVSEFANVNDAYAVTLQHLWPNRFYRQTALTIIVWAHGIIGIHYSLRLYAWYPRIREPFLIVAVVIPLLAIAGYIAAGREAVALAHPDARWSGEQAAVYTGMARQTYLVLLAAAAGLALAIAAMALMRRFGRRIPVRYVGHGGVALPRGSTLLETSRGNNIPHPSVCGGRARCSTCRVLVLEGSEMLPAPGPAEKALLERISAPPKVRLACQIRPSHPILVQILMPVTANAYTQSDWADDAYEAGAEAVATVLFIDLRAFTELTKTQFPYDLVALLNRYMSEIQQAIEAHGGKATMYLSDGMMAVFGLSGERGQGSRAAIAAARDMIRAIEAMNVELHAAMPIPLRVGIGIHTGPIILGRIGDEARGYKITALGETVTIASSLEAATKRQLTDCLISQDTMRAAGGMNQASSRHEVHVPGRSDTVIAYGLEKQSAEELAT